VGKLWGSMCSVSLWTPRREYSVVVGGNELKGGSLGRPLTRVLGAFGRKKGGSGRRIKTDGRRGGD